jgi:hypothetical protein
MKRIEILIDEANPDKKIGISYNKDSFENNEEVLAVLLGATIGFVKENISDDNKVLYLQVCIGTMQTYQKKKNKLFLTNVIKIWIVKILFFYDIIQILKKSKEKTNE